MKAVKKAADFLQDSPVEAWKEYCACVGLPPRGPGRVRSRSPSKQVQEDDEHAPQRQDLREVVRVHVQGPRQRRP